MFNINLDKGLRSVLIAGDSNLKQLKPMFDYPVRTLCIPGARVQNDRKEFYSQLMSAMKTENPDEIVLHLGSNDVFGDVESTLRNGAFILKMTLENYLAERQKCVTYMNATLLSPVQVPDVESLSPKMTYAEVVRLSVPSSDTRNRPFDKDVDHQNSSRTPSNRKRLCLAGARRTIKRRTDTRKQPVESVHLKQSKKTAVTKKEKKSTYNCPVCPVTCSREDFLIDHVICRHAKKGTKNRRTCGGAEEFLDENDKDIHDIEYVSVNIECSSPTIEFAEIGETEFSIPPTIELAETDEMESCSQLRIEFPLPTLKVLASKCWKNFKSFILHLCGDVEMNPGPTMLTCKWEQCTENKFTDVRLLAQHVISHISPGIVCQWEECVYCCPNDQHKLESHVLKHIYLEQFAFHSIEEWGRALPSGQFSETCTDLHLCPPNLVETMSEDTTASQSGTEPSTSTSGNNTTELTIQGIDPLAILNSNMTRSSQHVIVTNRPELTSTNQSTVKFRLQDETEIVTRKYISGNSKKRKHAASSSQKFNDENMTGNDLITNLNICRQAILVEHNIITKMQDMKFLDPKNKFLSSFEEAAINMSTYPDCSEGVFIFSIHRIRILQTFHGRDFS
ncbi:unnamed protein product [Mytilus edulis]|uniref:C2H2-type domain-containing protein n=1 Tax=Mytilus edulis TaxID=6550 RepID=A0A8S3SUD1_MYTED|nr:unnamed protein product [Mytilus edulis]